MRILLIWLVCFIPGIGFSQHYHFIYIQGDNQQTFYVKKAGELISSSSTGFVIVPKLQSGTHQFIIGFPKNQWPEFEFQTEIRSNDRGFTLRNFDDKGWGLFDLQSTEVIMGRKIEPPKAEPLRDAPKSDDPFSVILASAVGDEGIRETGLIAMTVLKPIPVAAKASTPAPPAVKKETALPKPVSEPPAPVADQKAVAVNTPPVSAETAKVEKTAAETSITKTETPILSAPVKTEPQQKTESLPELKTETTKAVDKPVPESKNMIRKISEIKLSRSTELIYLDVTGSVTDTIVVVIDDPEADVKQDLAAAGKAVAVPVNRADCNKMATEKDMLAVRKKVLTQGGEEEMFSTIMKDIKAKCYTVDLLQNLSYAFVDDKMRYRLFEEAYPHIYDPANYGGLERLLNSDEYIARFRTLIKNN